jgi:hypothetical protein
MVDTALRLKTASLRNLLLGKWSPVDSELRPYKFKISFPLLDFVGIPIFWYREQRTPTQS